MGIRYAYILAKLNGRNTSFVVHDQIERQRPLRQRNMTAMQNSSCGYADLLVALTAFIFPIREQPAMCSFTAWAYKAIWPAFLRKIFIAAFFAAEFCYECCKSLFGFNRHLVIPPLLRSMITFYSHNSCWLDLLLSTVEVKTPFVMKWFNKKCREILYANM